MTDQSVTRNKYAAILDAARAVFSRDGYAASSVDDVAAEAGIAKGTVYLYFKSKEDLYLAALLRDVKRVRRRSARRNGARAYAARKDRSFPPGASGILPRSRGFSADLSHRIRQHVRHDADRQSSCGVCSGIICATWRH